MPTHKSSDYKLSAVKYYLSHSHKLKYNSDCFVFLTHHEIKENKQGEPHSPNMSPLKWVGKNLHIKPFEIEEYLVDNFKECSNNPNEFGCIYKFNNKSN